MKSPTINGLLRIIEKDENKSDKIFCNANATAIQAIPSHAKTGVKSTQILVKNTKIHKAQTKTVTIVSTLFLAVLSLRKNFSIEKFIHFMRTFVTKIITTHKNIDFNIKLALSENVKKLIAIYISIKTNIHLGNLFMTLLINFIHLFSDSFTFNESNFFRRKFIEKYRIKNIKTDTIIIHIVFQKITVFIAFFINSNIFYWLYIKLLYIFCPPF